MKQCRWDDYKYDNKFRGSPTIPLGIKEGRYTLDVLEEPIEYIVQVGFFEDKYSVSEMRTNPRPSMILSLEEYELWEMKINEENKDRKETHKIQKIIWSRT